MQTSNRESVIGPPMERERGRVILMRALTLLLICLAITLFAYCLLLCLDRLQEAGLIRFSIFLQNVIVIAFVLGMFGSIAVTWHLALALECDQRELCLVSMLFPFGQVGVYFYLRSKVRELIYPSST